MVAQRTFVQGRFRLGLNEGCDFVAQILQAVSVLLIYRFHGFAEPRVSMVFTTEIEKKGLW
jgi:hypothetical protein